MNLITLTQLRTWCTFLMGKERILMRRQLLMMQKISVKNGIWQKHQIQEALLVFKFGCKGMFTTVPRTNWANWQSKIWLHMKALFTRVQLIWDGLQLLSPYQEMKMRGNQLTHLLLNTYRLEPKSQLWLFLFTFDALKYQNISRPLFKQQAPKISLSQYLIYYFLLNFF